MPPERAFEKYKAQGLFLEFYGNAQNKKQLLKLHMRLTLHSKKIMWRALIKSRAFIKNWSTRRCCEVTGGLLWKCKGLSRNRQNLPGEFSDLQCLMNHVIVLNFLQFSSRQNKSTGVKIHHHLKDLLLELLVLGHNLLKNELGSWFKRFNIPYKLKGMWNVCCQKNLSILKFWRVLESIVSKLVNIG